MGTPNICWRIEQHICGTTLHVDKKLMNGLLWLGAKDYYTSKKTAEIYAKRYALSCARMGMSSSEIYVVAGTMQERLSSII